MNSAPFIQDAHARACSILKNADREPDKPDYSLLSEDVEKEIVRKIAAFPETFIHSAENLSPNTIAEYANDLSAKFNSFYASYPVLKAEKPGLRDARLAMVDAVRIVIRNSLRLIGIKAVERM
jgi:arginyl-tRNA synthetase